MYSPSRVTETLYQVIPFSEISLGESQYNLVLLMTVAFIQYVALKMHLALPKPNSRKFLPCTVT